MLSVPLRPWPCFWRDRTVAVLVAVADNLWSDRTAGEKRQQPVEEIAEPLR